MEDKDYKVAKETVGTATPYTPQRSGNLKFGEALEALKQGKRITCVAWDKEGIFIFMQTPSSVSLSIVPKMTSLPQSVKDIFIKRQEDNFDVHNSITYENQIAVVYPDNRIYGWAPTVHDVLQEDWIILDVEEETYLDRLNKERNELAIKLDKLTIALLNNTVPPSAVDILTEQKLVMVDYLEILNRRLK